MPAKEPGTAGAGDISGSCCPRRPGFPDCSGSRLGCLGTLADKITRVGEQRACGYPAVVYEFRMGSLSVHQDVLGQG